MVSELWTRKDGEGTMDRKGWRMDTGQERMVKGHLHRKGWRIDNGQERMVNRHWTGKDGE